MAIPSDLAGLTVWLRDGGTDAAGDSDPVSTWANEGSGADFTGTTTTRPLRRTGQLNGLDAVRFDGVDDQLTGPTISTLVAAGGIYTLFVVAKVNTANARTPTYENSGLFNEADGYLGMFAKDVSGSLALKAFNWDGADHAVTAAIPPLFGAYFFASQDHSATTLRLGVNGSALDTFTTGATDLLTGLARVGQGVHATLAFLNGDIAEVVLYDNVLDDSARQSIESYLAAKWFATPAIRADYTLFPKPVMRPS